MPRCPRRTPQGHYRANEQGGEGEGVCDQRSRTMRPTRRLQPSANGRHRTLLNHPDRGQRRAALGQPETTHYDDSTAGVPSTAENVCKRGAPPVSATNGHWAPCRLIRGPFSVPKGTKMSTAGK